MKIKTSILTALLAGAGLVLTGGCIVPAGPGYVSTEVDVGAAPPPLIVETPPPMPAVGFVWVGGAWAWNGGRWVWDAGRWQEPPHPGAVWVPHRYVYRNGRHVFVRGGWR